MTSFEPTTFRWVDPMALKRTIAVRWTGLMLPSTVATHILKLGYTLAGDTENLAPIGWYIEDDKVMILELETEELADRITEATAVEDIMIGETRIKVRKLIAPNGIRIRDSIDLLKCNQHNMDDSDVVHFMTDVLAIYDKEKDELANATIGILKNLLESMFYKAEARLFGSYSTPLRRQGTSDIDMTFWFSNPSVNDANDPNLKIIRTDAEVQEEIQRMVNDPSYLPRPFTKYELESIPKLTIFRALSTIFKRFGLFAEQFLCFYFASARVPVMVLKRESLPYLHFDISLNNKAGYEKAEILQMFMTRDLSEEKKLRKCMIFIVHWARCNKLLGGVYPEEHLERSGFNSYIFNHLVIHFIQFHTQRQMFQMNMNPQLRVSHFNFDEFFPTVMSFFKEFFRHLGSINFSTRAIYSGNVIDKYTVEQSTGLLPYLNSRKTVEAVHAMKSAPLVVMDPMEPAHNIAKRVTDDDIARLKQLVRNACFILKQRNMNIATLLETNKNATIIMSSISWSQRTPSQETLTFDLPEVIQTSSEFCLLLNKILRFEVSAAHEGTSSSNLLGENGVIFFIYGKAWIGRRNLRRQLKNRKKDATNLEIELEVSRSFEFSYDEPVAIVRVFMREVESEPLKTGTIEMLEGSLADMHDAFHFLIDQFLTNNMQDLAEIGVEALANM